MRRAVLAVVCLALALVVAGVAMLNVALPTMTRALGASQTDQQWIVAVFLGIFLYAFDQVDDLAVIALRAFLDARDGRASRFPYIP